MTTRAKVAYSIARAYEPDGMTLAKHRIVGDPPRYIEVVYTDDSDGTELLVRHPYVEFPPKQWAELKEA